MARKRMISPEIWESLSFSALSDFAKLVFISLISHADDEGRGKAKPGYITNITFPNDENRRVADVKKALSEIALCTSTQFYTVDGNEYYVMSNWPEYQKIDRPTKSKLPPAAVTCCTIGDYLAMRLCGLAAPRMDDSNAASIGFFDAEHCAFDQNALQKAGIDPNFVPQLAAEPVIGHFRNAAVCAAIGDNQASFLRSVRDKTAEMLVNVGTGSQFSVFTPHYLQADGLETRPMPGGGYLLAGASLCGGRAYALLEQFFRSTASMLGTETNSCYDAMTRLLDENPRPDDVPAVCTLFEGTRADSSLTGSISGLTTHNFTPLHLIYGVMDGMADELHRMYTAYRQAGGTPKRLIGSGNGLRQNRYLQQRFESAFGCPLTLSDGREEAAAGAAQFAAEQQI